MRKGSWCLRSFSHWIEVIRLTSALVYPKSLPACSSIESQRCCYVLWWSEGLTVGAPNELVCVQWKERWTLLQCCNYQSKLRICTHCWPLKNWWYHDETNSSIRCVVLQGSHQILCCKTRSGPMEKTISVWVLHTFEAYWSCKGINFSFMVCDPVINCGE